MCLVGEFPVGTCTYYVDGKVKLKTSGHHSNLTIRSGSALRIGVLARDSGEDSIVIGEMSQFNIWEYVITSGDIFGMSRGCHADVGNVISWTLVQFWLHDSVTKKTPSSCTSAGVQFKCPFLFFFRLFTVPYYCVGFSRLVCFDRTPTISVCNGGRNRVPHTMYPDWEPLGGSDTLARFRSPLETKMVAV